MRKVSFRFLVTLAFLAPLVFVVQINAQKTTELVADIPFNFTACREQMPAGKYKIYPISSANPRMLLVRGEDNRSVEILCTRDVRASKPTSRGKVIFNRYGNEYFLSELWFAGDLSGNQVAMSEREQAIVKTLPARKKSEKVTVTVIELKPN
jgi:hypothetical protein